MHLRLLSCSIYAGAGGDASDGDASAFNAAGDASTVAAAAAAAARSAARLRSAYAANSLSSFSRSRLLMA